MQFDISRLSIGDTLHCDAALRAGDPRSATLEAAAGDTCAFLYASMLAGSGARACALVRSYITHPYAALPPDDRTFAERQLDAAIRPAATLKCLTLLGTRGDLPEWNDRRASRSHRVIPLPSAKAVEQAPMIAQLFRQLGVDVESLVHTGPRLISDPNKRTYNVFHVEHALGSPYIPAQQEFVKPHRIESVVGFGGALPWGEHFAVILFSRAHIPTASADRFKPLALAARARLRNFNIDQVFEADRGHERTPDGGMLYREFVDSRGTTWQVWQVVPGVAEQLSRRQEATALRDGWLLFESSEQSRRLRPIPPDWRAATNAELESMCDRAVPKGIT